MNIIGKNNRQRKTAAVRAIHAAQDAMLETIIERRAALSIFSLALLSPLPVSRTRPTARKFRRGAVPAIEQLGLFRASQSARARTLNLFFGVAS